MNRAGKFLLILAGSASAAFAVLHVAVIAIGAPAYRYFGAGEKIAGQAEAGSPFPALLTACITLVLAIFAAYGFSGAGIIRRLPLIRVVLVAISAVYLLRGLSALPQGATLLGAPCSLPVRYFLFSLVSLLVGLCYALGTVAVWKQFQKTEPGF